ncbi:MAG: ABC transporter substrate-binding protein [Christensenellales bacterium]|jgi:spermidine/putrescine transport system substrate-binding protein
MKRKLVTVFFVLILAVVAALALPGCSSRPTLKLLNWGDYIEQSVIDRFEDEYGIDVNYIPVTSNEEMYVSLTTEGADYDLVIPSDYLVERLIREDMLRKINFSNIPNIKNIDKKFLNKEYDPTGEYSVPYTWGTVGILYNKTMVTEPVTSWNIMWDEKYAGKIYMYNSMRDSIGATLKKLGYSLNTRDESQVREAVEELKKQKPLVKSYGTDELRDSMIGGSGAMWLTYSGDAVYCMQQNEDLEFSVPEEGSNLFFDCMVIPKSAKNPEAAEKFINFLLQPDVAKINTEYIGYSTPNAEALKILDEKFLANNAFNPEDDVIARCEVFGDLGEFTQVYSDAWQEVKLYNP